MRRAEAVRGVCVAAMLTFAAPAAGRADDADVQQLKATVEEMSKTIDALKAKIDRLEKQTAQTPAAAAAVPPTPAPVAAAPAETPAEEKTEQEAAAEYTELVLSSQGIGPQAAVDPRLRGFIPVPYTKVLMRFNAKPRVDFTYDTNTPSDGNPGGARDRFIPGYIPVAGDPAQGGGPVFNANGRGSQLIVDVRAPAVDGSPRFYYQNDFFGSGGGEFPYRIQQLFGQIYGLTVGYTYSPFEDPDIWPDTVDYEGPNSMIFARSSQAIYQLPLGDSFSVRGSVGEPNTQAADYNGQSVSGTSQAPDFAFNARWDNADRGHAQLSTVFRDLGARSELLGDDHVFGWGVNLAGGIDVAVPFGEGFRDRISGQVTYGEGIGSLGNDTGFFDTDTGFTGSGELRALPYLGLFVGYTHRWALQWRSTLTYGYVNLDSLPSMGPTAYNRTQYASGNLVWQLRERLSVGVEVLYGHNTQQSGKSGDDVRSQVGVAYSIF